MPGTGVTAPGAPAAAGRDLFDLVPGPLKAQVDRWAQTAGWRLVWKADTDLVLDCGASFAGDFAAATRGLFEGLHDAGSPYRARLFHANRVIIVEDR